MEFRIAFDPKPFTDKITIHEKVFLIGSCFTEHMHSYFSNYKFDSIQNPHGTLFNPISIFNSIQQYIEHKEIHENELYSYHGLWSHWDFHSRWSDSKAEVALQKMNSSIHEAHGFLKNTKWLIITLGSGFVYEFEKKRIVANCHKVPSDQFKKRLLHITEIENAFIEFYTKLKAFNPSIKIVFTISPVRHLRDGFIENNRSKAILHHVVGQLVNNLDILYFPSFELIIDDLRDYRFYAEDMVHPNYQATQYVWEKFCSACIEGKTRAFMKELDQLYAAMKHKPIHPSSIENIKFKEKFKSMVIDLSNRYPELQWEKEIAYFTEN